MMIPWTLERYIFREMGKTFLLTATALTGALGLGGGVMQMVELGEVTPAQLLRLMALVLPVAAALTLPVAALFSATATYGRLSADNEFVACRGGGINLHVLFLPAVALSLASATVTFLFISFLIPRMIQNLGQVVESNVAGLIEQRLNRPRGLKLGDYRIYADEMQADPDRNDTVALHRVAFVQTKGESWVRYGSALSVRLNFDRQADRIRAAAVMSGLTLFDRKEGSFSEVGELEVSAPEAPVLLRYQIKFMNLWELFHYWANPTEWPPVAETVERLRTAVGRLKVHEALLEDWKTDKTITLSSVGCVPDAPEQGGGRTFTLRAQRAEAIPGGDGVELTDAVISEKTNGKERMHAARRVVLEVVRAKTPAESGIRIEGYEVRVTDGAQTVERAREELGPAEIPPQLAGRIARLSVSELLEMETSAATADPLAERRKEVREQLGGTVRRIAATFSERAAFSFSVLVLVLLGAVLGIVFRGSQAVVAFGISFVPSLFVIILIVTGKQLSQNTGTHIAGLATMWSGIVVTAFVDWWTLVRVLRR